MVFVKKLFGSPFYGQGKTLPCYKKGTSQPFATNMLLAKTDLQKATGLMFRSLHEHQALFFPFRKEQRFSLHMFFVFTPIDVLFCQEDQQTLLIVDVKKNFKPFTLYTSSAKATVFVELPAGTITKHSLKKGDVLAFK